MAKQTKSSTPVTPNFRDVDKVAAQRAAAALAGGQIKPLTPPKDAKVSTDQKTGTQYTRWSEKLTIVQAYRTVGKSGLMDIVVHAKVRQSSKENTGEKIFAHHYLNLGEDVSEGHEKMNDRSYGAILSLLAATGFKPSGDTVKGSLLDRMFPSKGQPGVASPLNGKSVVGNIQQQLAPQKDKKTNKPVLDEEGEPILDKRDNIDSYLPDGADAESDEEE